jgi:cytochrome c oxidase assembly protein subunit 11
VVAAVAVAMVGMSYAAVPLYRAFCQATGYGGTPKIAAAESAVQGRRTLLVRFDTNVAPGLAWTFEPEVPSVRVRTGQTATVYFKVTNQTARATVGRAAFNISPDNAGAFFDKVACFCFEEQKLDPGETVEMPVVFFLDPALEKDETMQAVDSVTLSYTFFASKTDPKSVADAKSRPEPQL